MNGNEPVVSEPFILVGGSEPNVEGSRPYPCEFCGGTVYLAPGGQRRLTDGVLVACVDCAAQQAAEAEEVSAEAADIDELLREVGAGATHCYILVDRRPVPEPDLHAWAEWLGKSDDRVVKQEQIGPYEVSTVFLGVDHNLWRAGPPILFETMVFLHRSRVSVDYQTRCATWEEAEAMHDAAAQATRRMISG